ncbi:MAG: DUF309 domain-containing protein [Alphaproteobacteria bacterium]
MPRVEPTFEERLEVALGEARDLLERGLDFEAHEVLEPVWLEASGDSRRWLQGVIQFAASGHHLRSGRERAARSVAARASERLADAPEHWHGFPLGRVARAATRRAGGASTG